MPRRAMRNGFSFDRRKVDDISNAMRIPTTVDLQQKNGVCFQKDFGLPDVDRYALCSQQARDDAESKTIANVGEDDHGHGDEVEVCDQVERKETRVTESCKDSNCEEGEEDYDCCGEENTFPEEEKTSNFDLLQCA